MTLHDYKGMVAHYRSEMKRRRLRTLEQARHDDYVDIIERMETLEKIRS